MKTKLLLALSFFLCFGFCLAQTVDVQYLNPTAGNASYEFLRLGTSTNFFGGWMHNISSATYGDGDDVSLFTDGDRDLTFRTGTGNVIFFPTSGGNVGIGTASPSAKLDVNGILRAQDKILVNKAGSYRLALNGETDSYIRGRNSTSETKFEFRTNGISYFDGGDLGIGTKTPAAKLHVNGTIRGQDFLTVNKGGSYGIALNAQSDSYIRGRNAAFETKFELKTNGNTYFNGGNVGIGTISPSALLEVNKNINNGWVSKMFNGGGDGFGLLIQSGYGGAQSSNTGTILQLEDGNGNLRMKVQSNGKVGIGTTDIPNGYKLAIAGNVIAEEINVQLQSQWPDYVFEKDYELPTLKEVESYIQQNGHLPNIPSASMVKENGTNLGEMDAKLLQKIEEMMLYTIQQQKQIEKLEEELLDLKSK